MKRQEEVKDKLEEEIKNAEVLLNKHLNESDDGIYLRMYNKSQERIYVLGWVLGKYDNTIW